MSGSRIVVDAQAVQTIQNRLGQFANKAPNVIANALNRTVSNISTNISKEVRGEYNIKASDVKATLKTFRANKSNLSAAVISKGKPIGLDRFKVSPKTENPKRKSQLKITVKKGETKQIPGAFVANINGIKIFKRDTNKRLPISRKFGPSVPQMVDNEPTVEKINQQSWATYQTRVTHEINRVLSRV